MSRSEDPMPNPEKVPDSALPPSPLTELMMSASHLFEFFTTLCEAGFTPNQALYLVAQPLRPNPEGPPA